MYCYIHNNYVYSIITFQIILWSIISGYLMQRLKSPIVGKLKSISKGEIQTVFDCPGKVCSHS